MRSLILRTLGGLVAAGVGLGVAAAPAAAADGSTFRLSAGGVVGYGTYRHMMSNPERPVPPVQIAGSLVARNSHRCAVFQVAYSGPADGIEWRTLSTLCGSGQTRFRVQANYLFRGVQPPVRLCAGRTPAQAAQGRRCDQFRPPTAS